MDFEAAKKAYEEAIRLEPKKSEPYLGMANLYVAQDQPDKAEAVLKKAVKQVAKKEQEKVKARYQFYTYPKKVLKKETAAAMPENMSVAMPVGSMRLVAESG